jgi:hypothetical protein
MEKAIQVPFVTMTKGICNSGIIAMLDKHVMAKQYGRLFIESLP